MAPSCLVSPLFVHTSSSLTGFSSSFLKSSLPGFISSSQHLVELLGQKADRQEVVHMHHVAILTTLEIICKVCVRVCVDKWYFLGGMDCYKYLDLQLCWEEMRLAY
jgi:hypothetical protein